jgi:hypothetical protein
MDDIGREAASTLLARQQRNGRLYDVPQIGESGSSSTPGVHSADQLASIRQRSTQQRATHQPLDTSTRKS